MAVYKIFPEKDATIYSLFPSMNTGLDEIIEATLTAFSYTDPNPQVSRFLIKFSNDSIAEAFSLIPQSTFNSGSWKANLQCYIATSTGMLKNTTLDIYPVYSTWDMGTGRYLDEPISTDGTSWIYSAYSGSTQWLTSSYPPYVSASYNTNYAVAGGGTWYTGSPSPLFTGSVTQSLTFSYFTTKDININVTNNVNAWVVGAMPNEGFILKQREEWIYSKDFQPELKYFSRDTHTIYPPAMQISWRDYTWDTGSSTQTILDTLPATLTLAQNPGTFYSQSYNRFRINARPTYPPQLWQTSSVYINNYFLPTASWYAIKDLDTNEYVVEFDDQFTQLSADSESSYFDVYMNGLEPERYYAILIKTDIAGTVQVFDDQYYFKVING